MIEEFKEIIEILQNNSYLTYVLAIALGISIGYLVVQKVHKKKKSSKGKKKRKNLFSEHIQSLALAVAATCFATTIGYAGTLIDDAYITFTFLVILFFLIGMSFTIFCVVAYHLYKK